MSRSPSLLMCCALVCAALSSASPMRGQSTPTKDSVEQARQQLLDLENHWLQVEDDPKALESIFAPDFLHAVPAGIITRDEQLSFMRKHPSPRPAPARRFEDMHVRVYGTVGIVNGVVVADDAKSTHRTLFTDVFYRDGKWQAVNAQELPASETH